MSSLLPRAAGVNSQRRRASIGGERVAMKQSNQGQDVRPEVMSRARARGAELARKMNEIAEVVDKQGFRKSPLARNCGTTMNRRKSLPARPRRAELEPHNLTDKVQAIRESEHRVSECALGPTGAVSLPLKSLEVVPESLNVVGSKTPTATPAAIDKALRRSEMLLAEMNVGLNDFGLAADEQYVHSSTEEGSSPKSQCSTPDSPLSQSSDSDLPATVEVPVALLDMFFGETLSTYQNQTSSSPPCTALEECACEIPAAISKMEARDGPECCATRAGSDLDMLLPPALSVGSSVVTTPLSSCSSPPGQCSSPPREIVRPVSLTRARFMSPSVRRAGSPRAIDHHSTVNSGHFVPSSVRIHPRVSPQKGHMSSAPVLSQALLPTVKVDPLVFGGRKTLSCKVTLQQTVTITNRMSVTFEVA